MNDHHIRTVLRDQLSVRYSRDCDTIILEELGLRHGSVRVDLVVVNNILHGFEIKSDRDRLRRLPDQVRIYSSVLDRITLVVGYRHAYEAMQIVPEWWGVTLAEMKPSGVVCLSEAREPKDNPSTDIRTIVALLWRDEALTLLKEFGAANGVCSKPRAAVYERLIEVSNPDHLRYQVRQQLKCRRGWRADAQQMSSGD